MAEDQRTIKPERERPKTLPPDWDNPHLAGSTWPYMREYPVCAAMDKPKGIGKDVPRVIVRAETWRGPDCSSADDILCWFSMYKSAEGADYAIRELLGHKNLMWGVMSKKAQAYYGYNDVMNEYQCLRSITSWDMLGAGVGYRQTWRGPLMIYGRMFIPGDWAFCNTFLADRRAFPDYEHDHESTLEALCTELENL